MNATITRAQYSILEGLAYRIADLAYRVEQKESEAELSKDRATVDSLISEADHALIPWSVQNVILVGALDWRRYLRIGTEGLLNARDIKRV